MDGLTIFELPNVGAIVIRKASDSKMFITTPDSVIISKPVLVEIVRLLTESNLIDFRILEGILEEIHSA